uniref:Putative lanthionine synthetase C-like protein n=1 Tax=Moniliophthora roreri TaxID=221103 RepID=A0A0W0FUW4_MONRR
MTSRYIRHSHEPSTDLQALQEKLLRLTKDMESIRKEMKDKWADGTSVYSGVSGYVMMVQSLSSLSGLHSVPQVERATTYQDGDIALLLHALKNSSSRPNNPSKASFLETPIGTAVLVITHVLDAGKPPETTTPFCSEILQCITDAVVNQDDDTDDGSEVLYGRAGLLYGLLRIRRSLRHRGWVDKIVTETVGFNEEDKGHLEKLRDATSVARLSALCQSIIHRGRVGASLYSSELMRKGDSNVKLPPLMWSWHSKRYLGAAHGVAGILHILLLCPAHIIKNYIPEIHQTAEWLLGCQDPHGNWPTKAPSHVSDHHSSHENDLVQWCHGASGVLIPLSRLLYLSYTSPDTYSMPPTLATKTVTSLRNGASVVYRHGLLRKGVGLCHGVAGSVYALLAVSDAIALLPSDGHRKNSEYYFLRAAHLAELATRFDRLTGDREMKIPDRPWSLYEGLAGMCCAWGEVYDRIEGAASSPNRWNKSQSGMPGFDDI